MAPKVSVKAVKKAGSFIPNLIVSLDRNKCYINKETVIFYFRRKKL